MPAFPWCLLQHLRLFSEARRSRRVQCWSRRSSSTAVSGAMVIGATASEAMADAGVPAPVGLCDEFWASGRGVTAATEDAATDTGETTTDIDPATSNDAAPARLRAPGFSLSRCNRHAPLSLLSFRLLGRAPSSERERERQQAGAGTTYFLRPRPIDSRAPTPARQVEAHHRALGRPSVDAGLNARLRKSRPWTGSTRCPCRWDRA